MHQHLITCITFKVYRFQQAPLRAVRVARAVLLAHYRAILRAWLAFRGPVVLIFRGYPILTVLPTVYSG